MSEEAKVLLAAIGIVAVIWLGVVYGLLQYIDKHPLEPERVVCVLVREK